MKPDPKILDDIARVASGAVNVFSGLQQQLREDMKSRLEDMAGQMDLVPRSELDDALTVLQQLGKKVTALEQRLEKLEGKKNTEKKKVSGKKK